MLERVDAALAVFSALTAGNGDRIFKRLMADIDRPTQGGWPLHQHIRSR